jgi:hypothetical protein
MWAWSLGCTLQGTESAGHQLLRKKALVVKQGTNKQLQANHYYAPALVRSLTTRAAMAKDIHS